MLKNIWLPMKREPQKMAHEVKSCAMCAYDMGPCWDDGAFPDPQDGSEPPMVITAALPDRREGGRHCVQFRRKRDP
jgi:hypothetical protein